MQKVVDNLMESISGIIAISVAEIESGMTLASRSRSEKLEPEMAAAYNAEVIKQKLKAKKALGLENQSIEDILITLEEQYHVIMIVPGNVYFIYAAASKESNLAIIRSTLRKALKEIKELL